MYKIVLPIIIIVLVIICVFYKKEENTNVIIIDKDNNINVDYTSLNEMADTVTKYSLKSDDYAEKLVLIYRATFHLFDMNFPVVSIIKLDDYVSKFKYEYNKYEFPQGELYHNLQRFIITNITHYIVNSERQLQNNFENDREIIYVYLRALFTHSHVMSI